MVNKTNWNCSLCATKPAALRGGSSATRTAPTARWEEKRRASLLSLAHLNDELNFHWRTQLLVKALLASISPPPLARSVVLALLRKQKEALRLDANIQFSVGPIRPWSNIAIIGYNVHKHHVYIMIQYNIFQQSHRLVLPILRLAFCFTWQSAAAWDTGSKQLNL